LNRRFDVFGRLLHFDVAVSKKLLENAKRFRFSVLRLNLERWPMMQGDSTPTQRPHILHCMAEEFVICHSSG